MPIEPSVEKSHVIEGILAIFTFGVGSLDWSSEPLSMYDYINFYSNDNSFQIHLSIVFKLSDHKANICSYPRI